MHPGDETGESAEDRASPSRPTAARTIPVADHRIDSRDLFIGTRELVISHGHEIYRLRLTSQNKLILTK